MQIPTRGIAALLSLGLLGAACHSGGTRTQSPAAAPASTPYGGPAAAPAARPSAPTAPMALQSGGSNLDSALATARSTGKPVVLLFLASWCGWCKKLESQTLSNPAVQAELANFTALRMDPDGAGKALADRYTRHTFPTVVVLDANGNVKKQIVGYEDANAFAGSLRSAR